MFQQLLEKLALELDRRAIPYMVIGGQAVLVHGEPRLTRDIDVTLGVDAGRIDDILALAAANGWKVLVDAPEQFVGQTLVLPCEDAASGIRIDFIFSNSAYERQAIVRSRRISFDKTDVCFASAEDLIVHKIIAGRPRDIEDVRTVLLKNPSLDSKYVRRWLRQFETEPGESFTRRFEELLRSLD